MGRVFAVRPKRIKRTNGQVLTPEMEITVTTKSYTCDPFVLLIRLGRTAKTLPIILTF